MVVQKEFSRLARIMATLLSAVLLLSAPAALRAQDTEEETWRLSTGDIVEILGTHDDPGAQFSWVLERDGIFVQAARTPTFRTRFVETGKYRLSASASAIDGTPLSRHILLLDVRPRASDDGTSVFATGTIVTTNPPSLDGTLSLASGQEIVVLTPNTAEETILQIDVDTSVDTSGDGDPANDDDAAGTFFHSARLPVWVWFPVQRAEREMRVRAKQGGTETATQTVRVVLGSEAVTEPPSQDSAIAVDATADGALAFALPQLQTTTLPLLFTWSFGDGAQSMETFPVHRYLQSGTYDVRVSVRNLQSGTIVFEASRSLIVTAAPSGGVSSASAESSSSSAPATTTEPGGGKIMLFVQIALILLGAILAGAGGVWLVGKLLRRSGGGLQRTLEQMESLIVNEKEAAPNHAPPPLAIRPPDTGAPPQREPADLVMEQPTAPEAPQPPVQIPPEPIVETENAPTWLRKGLAKAEQIPTRPPAPQPEPQPEAFDATPPPLPVTSTAPPSTPPPAEERIPALPTEPPVRDVAQQPSGPSDITPPPEQPAVDMNAAPPWLRKGLEAKSPVVPAPPSPPPVPPQPPPTSPPEPVPPPPEPAPPIPEEKPAEVPPAAPAPEPEPPAPQPEPTPPPPPLPVPSPTQATVPVPAQPAQPTTDADRERQERERERKRLKRKRYRENLKKRQQAGQAAAPEALEKRSVVSGQRPAISDQQSVISGQGPAVSDQLSARPPTPSSVTPSLPVQPEQISVPPPPPIQPEPTVQPPAQPQAPQASPPPTPSPGFPPKDGTTAQPGKASAELEAQTGDNDVVFLVEAENIKQEPEKDA